MHYIPFRDHVTWFPYTILYRMMEPTESKREKIMFLGRVMYEDILKA